MRFGRNSVTMATDLVPSCTSVTVFGILPSFVWCLSSSARRQQLIGRNQSPSARLTVQGSLRPFPGFRLDLFGFFSLCGGVAVPLNWTGLGHACGSVCAPVECGFSFHQTSTAQRRLQLALIVFICQSQFHFFRFGLFVLLSPFYLMFFSLCDVGSRSIFYQQMLTITRIFTHFVDFLLNLSWISSSHSCIFDHFCHFSVISTSFPSFVLSFLFHVPSVSSV